MVSIDTFRKMALAMPGAEEAPHFEKTSFRLSRKIFATLNIAENRCCVKLPLIEQSVFCRYDKTVMWPVPNKWGTHGWTLISLAKVKKSMLQDALNVACEAVAATVKVKKTRSHDC